MYVLLGTTQTLTLAGLVTTIRTQPFLVGCFSPACSLQRAGYRLHTRLPSSVHRVWVHNHHGLQVQGLQGAWVEVGWHFVWHKSVELVGRGYCCNALSPCWVSLTLSDRHGRMGKQLGLQKLSPHINYLA